MHQLLLHYTGCFPTPFSNSKSKYNKTGSEKNKDSDYKLIKKNDFLEEFSFEKWKAKIQFLKLWRASEYSVNFLVFGENFFFKSP